MRNLIAYAPYRRGIESATNSHFPSWMGGLSEARQAGFVGIELEPYGFLPLDADTVNMALYLKELEVCAGTISEPLSMRSKQAEILEKTERLCAFLQQIGTGILVVNDRVNDERSYYAGLSDEAPRLSEARWVHMMETISKMSTIAGQYHIRVVVLPHVGGYIEYEDEIERMLQDLPRTNVGLCLDTGHLYYAGMDPAQSLIRYAERLEHLHFSDIDIAKQYNAVQNRIGYWQACTEGVMCPLGEGGVLFGEVYKVLDDIGYKGWIAIEQRREPCDTSTILSDLKKSRQYLVDRDF
ncbi:sugar phosphate isomerase/epimerase [Photobacterium sp. SDRW27]|uniref:sugar phosphate isomerase/epimerase family protein n=1 Tax=Photobacterium obscurum TaxID=2829490 RepID=UPI002243DBCD|nr:sugar phosphate isomerase/epimerase [Photobacterium obscurum]MCW8330178.1 sugar phosphate isomerase/epimerase [Photobacterium obscurum]